MSEIDIEFDEYLIQNVTGNRTITDINELEKLYQIFIESKVNENGI